MSYEQNDNYIGAIFPNLYKSPRIEIKIIPSYHCDINCKYCYNKENDIAFYPCNYNDLICQLDRVFQRDDMNAIVEIIGGEPLSAKNYPLTKHLISYLNNLNKNIKIVLQTGSASLDKIVDLIPLIDGLSYSIDLSFSPKVKNIKHLDTICKECQKYSVTSQIQTILSNNDNPEDIFKFMKVCASHEIGWIGMQYPQYQRYTKSELESQVEIYLQIINFMDSFVELNVGGAIIESACDYIQGVSYSSSCMCGEKSITIQPDGTITPSLHNTLNKKYNLTEFARLKEERCSILKDGICSCCQFWSVCHGGCMAHAEFITGNAYSRDVEYCYVLSNVLSRID